MRRPIVAILLLVSACGGGSSSTQQQADPVVPKDLAAAPGNGSVALTWTAFANATSYEIFRSDAGGAAQIGTSTATAFVDSSVKNGVSYSYTIRAVTTAGTTADSTAVTALPFRQLCVSDQYGDRILMFNAELANATAAPPAFGSATGLAPKGIDVDLVDDELFSADAAKVNAHAGTATGNAAPLRTFANQEAQNIAFDPANNNLLVTGNSSVFTYSRTATGDQAPLRTLKTSSTIRKAVLSDPSHGDRLFVSTFDTNQILVYGRTDADSTPPAAVISPSDFLVASTLVYDPATDELLVAALGPDGAAVLSLPAASHGAATPSRILHGDQTGFESITAMALDPVNHRLYVADAGRILVFSSSFAADANVAPSWILAGPSTQLATMPVDSMVVDTGSLLHVQVLSRILTFDATASGDTAPIRSISSTSSGVERPVGVAFDRDRGELLVANAGPVPTLSSFAAATLSGTPAPSRILSVSTNLWVSLPGVAVDVKHDEMFTYSSFLPVIQVFRRGASANDLPLRTIAGDATGLLEIEDIGYDEANDAIVVVDNGITVRRFARTAGGNTAALTSLTVPNGASAIAADNVNGELFVATTDGVSVYHFTDDGQAAPVRKLAGLSGVQGLLVDANADQLFVLDGFGSTLHVFPRTASGAAAPLRSLNAQGAFAWQGFHMAICN